MTPSDLKKNQINSAIELFSKGEINQALDAVQDLFKEYPNDPLLFNIRGACHASLGQLDVAVTNYEEAISIKPDYAKAHFNLGGSLHELGQLKAAVKSYEKTLEIEPGYAEAHNNLGNVFKELEQNDAAVKSYKKALEFKPDYVEAQYSLGIMFQDMGQFDEAVKSYKAAIKLKPDFVEAINNLGIAFYKLRQPYDAMKCYEKALVFNPDFADAHNNIGIVLLELGQLEETVKSYKAALKIKPNFAEAHFNLGVVLQDLKQLDDAIISYKAAIVFHPEYSDAHYNLGIIFHEIGQLEMAIKSLEIAIIINPENAEAHKYLGNTFQLNGQIDEAIKCYKMAISIKPDYADAHRNLTTVKKYTKGDAQIVLMQELLSHGTLSDSDQIYICFALAKAYEDLGEQDDLFKALHEGNRLRKIQLNYSLDNSLKEHSNLKNLFNLPPSIPGKLVSNESSKIRPIFIVGMPRSGTSLVEQIISSHYKTHGAGELNILNELIIPIVNDLAVQDADLSENIFLSIRKNYLDYLSSLNVPENVITDKMPTNFQYIGFILQAFPEAKVINLKRDSRAVCWSIYKNYFPGSGLGFAFNMKDLASYYNSYNELMSFWHQTFPNKIYNICYEDLTTNQEEETKKLLEYCELAWDDNCLNFQDNKRAVRTTSSLQVRKKMYQGSSETWKNYATHIQPIIDGLKSY